MNELDRREDLFGACHWCWCAAVLLLCALVAQALALAAAAPPIQAEAPKAEAAGPHRDMRATPAPREEER